MCCGSVYRVSAVAFCPLCCLRAVCTDRHNLTCVAACTHVLPPAARYFHPPGEILLAAVLGLAVFQAPLLLYATRAFADHHQHQQQAAVLAGMPAGGSAAAGARHRSE